MGSGDEARRQERFDVNGATGDLKNLTAFLAMEVVVVVFACDFIARGFAWEINCGKPAFLDQGLDISINGGDADALGVRGGVIEHFLRTQGTIHGFEDVADGGLLACIALESWHGTAVRVTRRSILIGFIKP